LARYDGEDDDDRSEQVQDTDDGEEQADAAHLRGHAADERVLLLVELVAALGHSGHGATLCEEPVRC
jgi:hypothetical protein